VVLTPDEKSLQSPSISISHACGAKKAKNDAPKIVVKTRKQESKAKTTTPTANKIWNNLEIIASLHRGQQLNK
jgi:hypothetical protein